MQREWVLFRSPSLWPEPEKATSQCTGPRGRVTAFTGGMGGSCSLGHAMGAGDDDLDDESPRRRARELVLRYGWNATSFQTLEDGYRYYFGCDGCVAYVDTGRAWVAAGAPICPPRELATLTRAFVDAASAQRRRVCFFAVEERLLAPELALDGVFIGEMPVWNPQGWHDVVRSRRSLREQLRRARAKGVRVRLTTPTELLAGPVRDAISSLGGRWLDTRAMAPMGFLVSLEPFTFPDDRRCFVAERDGQLVGFAGVVPVPARGGWFIEDLVRDVDAPNGTAEALVDAVMRWAKDQRCQWLTLGLAPLAGEVAKPLGWFRSHGRALYDFEGLRAYKAKLSPLEWRPVHLAFPVGQGLLLSVVDALVAFTRGGLVRFAARSILRGPRVVLFGMFYALVAWIVGFAFAPTPTIEAKWIYLGLHVLLASGLLSVVKPRRSAAYLRRLSWVFALVAVDALAMWVVAIRWQIAGHRSWGDHLLPALACLGPTMAAVVLFGAWRRRARTHLGPAIRNGESSSSLESAVDQTR